MKVPFSWVTKQYRQHQPAASCHENWRIKLFNAWGVKGLSTSATKFQELSLAASARIRVHSGRRHLHHKVDCSIVAMIFGWLVQCHAIAPCLINQRCPA